MKNNALYQQLTVFHAQPTFNLCLKVADDINLFRHLGQKGSPLKTVAELAASTGTHVSLLTRILRHLGARGVVMESVGQAIMYRGTELSEALASVEGSSGIRHVSQIYDPLFAQASEYLKSKDYAVPSDGRNGPFQHILGKPG